MKTEEKLIYSILFLKGRSGSSILEISSILKISKIETKKNINNLEKELLKNNSPIILKWSEDKIRLTLSTEVSMSLSKKMNKTINVKLSKSVIESLTIIAYNQPTTKPDIERIRGVSSDYAIAKLLEFNLIEDAGQSDLPGKPILYVTTTSFLELFDISSLKDLPPLPKNFEEVAKKEVANLFEYD